jgi:hypothetical protein
VTCFFSNIVSVRDRHMSARQRSVANITGYGDPAHSSVATVHSFVLDSQTALRTFSGMWSRVLWEIFTDFSETPYNIHFQSGRHQARHWYLVGLYVPPKRRWTRIGVLDITAQKTPLFSFGQCSSVTVGDQVSHPYRTTCSITMYMHCQTTSQEFWKERKQ